MKKKLAALAFEAAPIGIVLAQDRVIQACNTAFCDLTGYTAGELVGQSFRRLYTSDAEFAHVRDIGLPHLTAGKAYSDLRLVRCKDATAVWCRFRAQTLDASDPLARTVLTYAQLADTGPMPELTPRERDVVLGLRSGDTSKVIAARLGLSPRSVEDVRARLLKKFRARNATEMLAKFTNIET